MLYYLSPLKSSYISTIWIHQKLSANSLCNFKLLLCYNDFFFIPSSQVQNQSVFPELEVFLVQCTSTSRSSKCSLGKKKDSHLCILINTEYWRFTSFQTCAISFVALQLPWRFFPPKPFSPFYAWLAWRILNVKTPVIQYIKLPIGGTLPAS